MIREIKILRSHGKQYIPDLDRVILTEQFRGRPEIKPGITNPEAEKLSELCPVAAINCDSGFSIDLGKCVFCKECAFMLPDKICFTNDYRMAVTKREDLVISTLSDSKIQLDKKVIRPLIRKMFSHSLKLRQVSAGGDNSCEMELNAAGNVNFDMSRFGIEFVASPRHADGIVVTGPVTQNMSDAIMATWEAIAEPKIIVLAGNDAISGGIFAESPAIKRSFFNDHTPDLLIPGNPVHPLSFIHGLLDLVRR